MLPKSNNNAEQNLIFAGLGLQLGMLSKEQVIRAFTEWLFDKSKPLPQILLDQKAMAEDRIKILKLAVEAHIQKEGNTKKALATLHMVKDLEGDLEHLGDQDLYATLDDAVTQRKQLRLNEQFTKLNLLDVSKKNTSFLIGNHNDTIKERFKRLNFFDAGNLGELFFAKDTELNRTVVVKYIKPDRANEVLTQALFHLEGEVTGVLEHPSIVPVYGLGKDSKGRLFYAMRYIQGRKLSKVISEYHAISKTEYGKKQESFFDLLQYFQAACLAIEYAHMKGVLHCDIKPDNIMIGDYGEVFIVDWGLVIVHGRNTDKSLNTEEISSLEFDKIPQYKPSDAASSGLHQNQGGSRRGVGGTPAYMAPEQLQATFDEDITSLGPGVDIYALGGTLFQILTGKPPHLSKIKSKETMEDFQKRILSGDFPRPRDLNGAIPKPLESIALKALNLNPEKRYDSARELAEDVKRWLADEPVKAFKEGLVAKTQRLARKNRTLVAVGSLFFVFLSLGLLGYTILTQSYNKKLRISEKNAVVSAAEAKDQKLKAEENEKTASANAEEAKKQRDKALSNEKVAMSARKAAENQLYVNNIQTAYVEWKFGSSTPDLNKFQSIPFKQRGWEHHFLNTMINSSQVTLNIHAAPVITVVFSPDGKNVISGGTDKEIRIWEASSGQNIKTLKGHLGSVIALAISPDGKQIASGGAENIIRIWDVSKGLEIFSIKGQSLKPRCIAFSPDGKFIISGGIDKTVKIWETKSFKLVNTLEGHRDEVTGVAFSPDGNFIVSSGGDKDRTVKIWDANNFKLINTLLGHEGTVSSVAFSPDGKSIASASYDQTIKVWDAASGRQTNTLKGHANYVYSIAYSPDGRNIYSGSSDTTIKAWSSSSGKEISTFKGHTGPICVALCPDGKSMVSGSADNTLKIWNIANSQAINTLKDHSGAISQLVFSPDQKKMITGSWDSSLKFWDLETNRVIKTLRGHSNSVNGFTISLDNKIIFSCSSDNTIKIWNAANGQELSTLKGHTSVVKSVAISPDGKRIVSSSNDKTIKIWDAISGKEILTLQGHKNFVNSSNFSPDGKRIVSGSSDGAVKLWDVNSGKEIFNLNGHKNIVTSVTFSPDGKRIVSGSWDRTIRIWDAFNGQEIISLKSHTDNVDCVLFSPDGSRIVSSSNDNSVKLWDSTNFLEILTLKEHTNFVFSANFSSDGKQLATGSHDKTVKIWNGSRPLEYTKLIGHQNYITRVFIDADGKYILSEDQAGIKKLWKTEDCKECSNDEIKNLSDRFGDNLTVSKDQEWSVKFHGDNIFLINNKLRDDIKAKDKQNLALWATPNPNWHFVQATEAEKNQEWFAATFHLKKLLKFDSHKENAKKLLVDIEPKLKVN